MAGAVLLAGCGERRPPPPPIATIQPGDSLLSCSDLLAKIAEMDRERASLLGEEGVPGGGVARQAVSTGLGFVPVVGPVLGPAAGLVSGGMGGGGGGARAYRQEQVVARKQQLVTLYNGKGCR